MTAENMHAIVRDDASAEWFDAAGEGRLLIRECGEGHVSAPQTITCPECGSTALQWIQVPGNGVLVSYAVVERRGADPLPVAIVELDEGPWMRMQIQDTDPATLSVGLPVVVRFATPEGGEPLPYAVPR